VTIPNCTAICGNGIVEPGEACDDGNTVNGDGCSAVCTVQPGYNCTGSPSVCTTVCGDGIVAGTEQCDDGNNANGDGCSSTCQIEGCLNGSTQACYSGPPGTAGVGVCAAGLQTCTAGNWGPCVGQVLPSTEVCNGLDDNCNGVVDENNPGGGSTCNTGLPGICNLGTTVCQSGVLVCVQNVQPTAEVCDGLDNNCNGQVDEGNPGGGGACNTGQPGVCAAGTLICQSGALVCVRNVNPSPEVCNGLDDNCDGIVDNGAACPPGMVCSNGACIAP
jgi:cysteine-rich repeat protein